MLANEADLGLAVAALLVPVIHDLRVLGHDLGANVERSAADELALLGEARLAASLLEHVAHVGVLVGPELTLGADDLLGPGGDEAGELVDVEGLAAVVDEGLDVVLEDLGVVVLLGVLHGVEPGSRAIGAVEVEAIGVEQLGKIDVAPLGLDDHGLFLQATDNALELVNLLARDLVDLVEHHSGAELDLLDEQGLEVVLVNVVGKQITTAAELVPHAGAVDHGNDVVEVERGGRAVLGLVAELRDGVGNGNGLADAGSLDDDVVEVTALGNLGELAGEVVRECAAKAAVGHGDELAVDLRQAALGD